MVAEGGSYVHDSGLLLLCYVFRTAGPLRSFSVAPTRLTRGASRHGGELLLHDVPIMRGRLHYRQDGRRNYKSTQDCEPTLRQPIYCIYGLNAFQASFSAPKTPLATILCSTVVFLTLSCGENERRRHARSGTH